jgi:hypothetical protein
LRIQLKNFEIKDHSIKSIEFYQGWDGKESKRLGLIGVPLQNSKSLEIKLKNTIISLFIVFFLLKTREKYD